MEGIPAKFGEPDSATRRISKILEVALEGKLAKVECEAFVPVVERIGQGALKSPDAGEDA
jgi:hypothetical protein